MKTTLNFPDDIIAEAKIRAVQEKTTLTDIIIQGLKIRLRQSEGPGELPVSSAGSGLLPGLSWEEIGRQGQGNEAFR